MFDREYKEALKQQRSQDVYKVKEIKGDVQIETNESFNEKLTEIRLDEDNNTHSLEQISSIERINSTTKTSTIIMPKSIMKVHSCTAANGSISNSTSTACDSAHTVTIGDRVLIPKKPIQKVIPSRHNEIVQQSQHQHLSNIVNSENIQKNVNVSVNGKKQSLQTLQPLQFNGGNCDVYLKPTSPLKHHNSNYSVGSILAQDTSVGGIESNSNGDLNKYIPNGCLKSPLMTGRGAIAVASNTLLKNSFNSSNKTSSLSSQHRVTWKHDLPTAEKSSFTMRREFVRQREETELMSQLRNVSRRVINYAIDIIYMIFIFVSIH